MTPFSLLCPEQALAETLTLCVEEPNRGLPPGEYVFRERYCADAGCDCRRVFIQVVSSRSSSHILASINYGWESVQFYTRKMHGDAQAGRAIVSADLDPINSQSEWSEALLNAFRDHLRQDPTYPQRLRRHYELFKHQLALSGGNLEAAVATSARSSEAADPSLSGGGGADAAVRPSSVEEILRQLQCVPKRADFGPYQAALEAAVEQRESVTPELIAAIARVTDDPSGYSGRSDHCLHLFAFYLLAQFREPRALDAFLRFLSLPDDLSLDLTGDMVTEDGDTLLASVCGGDPGPLLALALDEDVHLFVREQAVRGLLVQHVWGERSREELIADLRNLLQRLERTGESYVCTAVVGAIMDLDIRELLPEVRQAFAGGWVEEGIVGSLQDVESNLGAGPPRSPYQRPAEQRVADFKESHGPIDAIDQCSIWICFQDDDDDFVPQPDQDFEDTPPAFGNPTALPVPMPYLASPKIGRNDPCSCGSGKKFKKCCG